MLFSSQDAFAVPLFQDDFSQDPMSNGWTENFVVDFLDGINPLNPPHAGHGTEVIMEKNHFLPNPGTQQKRFFSINRIISTVGFENIQISLTAHQTSDNYEPKDFLEISIDTNGDGIFESVLKDVNIWEGMEDQSTVDTIAFNGNLIPTSTGFIPLPNTATNNPNLNIKIEASFNSYREDYFLTEFEVIGDAIQATSDVIGGNILYPDPHLGDPKHGQGHDDGFCMNLNCINVNGFFNHFSETTIPQGSTQTFTVLVSCPRGANTCNHISLAGALPDADFYDDRWSATVNRETKSDNWVLTVYNPFGEIGDDVTVTVQSVGQSFVTASFNIPFLIPGSFGTPDGIGDPQENNRHIHVTVWDSNGGASNYIFNEGMYVDDIYAYPQVETSYETPLEIEPLCLNENPNKRYTCAFDKVREWTIKNAEETLSKLK